MPKKVLKPIETIGDINIKIPPMKAEGTILHHYEVLLKMAEEAIGRDENALSIILSHAACEVFTERAFKLIFSYKKLEYLYDIVVKPILEYKNLKSKKVHDLYMVTTGDAIKADTKLWQRFIDHVDRRNKIVHQGMTANKKEAEASWEIVKELSERMNNVLVKLKNE